MRNITINKIEEFLIALSIFISSIVYFKQPFEGYFHYLIFLLFLPFFIKRYGAPVSVFKLLALPTLFSVFYVLIGGNTWFAFIKIFGGLILSCSFYYYVFVHYDFDVLRLFKLFIKGSKIVAIIGLIQGVSYLIGFKLGYDFRWIFNKWGVIPGGIIGIRLNSIFSEPSQFSIMLSPAIFLSIEHLISRRFIFISKTFCWLMILAAILSASTTGYLGMFFSVIILLINFRRIVDSIVIVTFVILAGVLLYSNVEEFKSRVDSYTHILNDEELTLKDINSSSFVQYNNYQVALKNFKKNPIAGTGLGSFPIAYEKYSLTKAFDFQIKKGFDFNSQDGNSLFVRVMAEMGLLGILFLVILIYKFFILQNNFSTYNTFSYLISGSVLILLLLTYFRQGNYFLNGFPFFMWLYYFNGKKYNDYKKGLLSYV